MKIKQKGIITSLAERFIPVDIKTVDSKNRINLGEKMLKLITNKTNAEAYQVFIGEEGDILLRPTVAIPAREAWIYKNPKVLSKIRQGLTEAQEGKIEKVENLDNFFKDL